MEKKFSVWFKIRPKSQAGVGKRNETKRKKRKIFRNKTKRNGKNYKIKKRNETKRKATGNETKRNDIIVKQKKTKRKEENNVS
jgi:hypothetical protein